MILDFGVIPHLIFNKTHLITGSLNITFSENLAELRPFSGETMIDFGISSIYN